MALHLINGMTVTPALLRTIATQIVSGDDILFLEMDEKIKQLWQSGLHDKQNMSGVGCYYLNNVPQSRSGLSPFDAIDTDAFVALTEKHSKTLSWF